MVDRAAANQRLILKLGEISGDAQQLQDIGSAIVREAVKNAAEERLGQKTQTPDVVRQIRRGDLVPGDLVNEPGLTFDQATRLANDGWEKTWLNLGLWDRNWSENETDIFAFRRRDLSRFGVDSPLGQVALQTRLTPEELQVLNDLQIRPGG